MPSINYVVGDATRPAGPGKKIIAHCCNNVGAWGAGFVIALSRRWPQPEACYHEWSRQSRRGFLPLGEVQFVDVAPEICVANIIGQTLGGYGDGPPVCYPSLGRGLALVGIEAVQRGASVHAPRLGCGLAGGSWETVSTLLERELIARGISVTIYDLKSP